MINTQNILSLFKINAYMITGNVSEIYALHQKKIYTLIILIKELTYELSQIVYSDIKVITQ
ncbi:hypothetical protein D9V80_00130 [Buchnera aphidicola (Thelaxes californica)]|uniref:Uncharacterized protein n=1 Tax=Buchnera aphidicola (Thelaxes californica) TaxID=1315998 RepID=A0A4D6YEW0_9GAMM|nr:hypothetical protein D9V80_00130 [Buchnera aphidicola (Thelaxes californica)]